MAMVWRIAEESRIATAAGRIMRAGRRSFPIVLLGSLLAACAGAPAMDTSMPEFCVSIPAADWEARHVWALLQEIEYYDRNNYDLSLPEDVSPPLLERARKRELTNHDWNRFRKDFAARVYNRLDYQKGYEAVAELLGTAERAAVVFRRYHEEWGFTLPRGYHVQLTLYGPGGSYDRKTGTIILLTTSEGLFRRGRNPLETILHEAVHMGIEVPIVFRYGLSHWTTERVVDKFMVAHFMAVCPEYRMQPNAATGIDVIFEAADVWDNLPQRVARYVSRLHRGQARPNPEADAFGVKRS
jgi:hypothetical protein